jgi:hypothetical protein
MWTRLILSSDIGKFADFVSPAFFQVVPAPSLFRTARSLVSLSRDLSAFQAAVSQRSTELHRAGLDVRLDARRGEREDVDPNRSERARQLVELYFHQIFSDSASLLDLRSAAFGWDGSRLIWSPKPWLWQWEAPFIKALRDLYVGFYGQDTSAFVRGLSALGLQGAEDVLRCHFGTAGAMHFSVSGFIDSFHAVFVRCKEIGAELHSDFLPLGIVLATLYAHLEELGVVVDVADCFARIEGSGRGPQQVLANG